MADAEIIVGIRGETEGGRIVKRTLDDIAVSGRNAQQGAKGLETQFNSLQGAGLRLTSMFKGLLVVYGVREIIQLTDAYTNVQNRLKLVTNNAAELAGVTKSCSIFQTTLGNHLNQPLKCMREPLWPLRIWGCRNVKLCNSHKV